MQKTYEPLISGKDHTIPSFAANQQGVLLGNEKSIRKPYPILRRPF